MNLIQYYQRAFVARQVKLRVGQFRLVRRQFQVEISAPLLVSKHPSQRRFADLPRAQKGDSGKCTKRGQKTICSESRNHDAILP
jgi:hypothetical protein